MVRSSERRLGARVWLTAVTAALAVPSTAASSQIAGRITGTPIPPAGSGEASVRASDLRSGVVARTDDVGADGRYRLTVPKGAYALFPTVITSTAFVRPKPTKVRLRAGQRKAVPLPVRRPAGVVRNPIVAIPDNAFTGLTGAREYLNRAMPSLLITDIFSAQRPANCRITIRDVSAAFGAAYQQEVALVRSGLVDPATAIRPGMLLVPTRGIRGRMTVTGSVLRIDAEVYKWNNKRTIGRTSVEGPVDDFFRVEGQLATKLVALLCDRPTPVTGTFSGSQDFNQVIGAPSNVRFDWTGNVEFVPTALQLISGTDTYEVRTGNLTATIRGKGEASDCAFSGTGSFTLVPPAGLIKPVAFSVREGVEDIYTFSVGTMGGGFITATLSDCTDPADNGKTKLWPPLFLNLPVTEQTTQVENQFQGSSTAPGTLSEGAYTWTWSMLG